MRRKRSQKGVDLGIYIDPKARRVFRGDPNRLRQILMNLVGNAIKFTERGSVSIEVSLDRADDKQISRVHFEVNDTGIGMSPEACSGLFQKFSQADNSITRRFGGTGLGLAIAKQLVELMGGEIGVSSLQGLGTSFHFDIVLGAAAGLAREARDFAADAADGVPAIRNPLKTSRPSGRRLNVLLAEDNKINRKFALAILAKAEHSVDAVENGREALEAVRRKDYDVVLMDVQMPEMDGEEATRQIRALPPPQKPCAHHCP